MRPFSRKSNPGEESSADVRWCAMMVVIWERMQRWDWLFGASAHWRLTHLHARLTEGEA